jgi:hypothetical protein
MAGPFIITVPTNTLHLDAQRQAEASYTVFNESGRFLRGRARITPQDPLIGPWLTLEGEVERDFPVAGAYQYTVHLTVPVTAPAGTYSFRLDELGVANPDEDYTEGPYVSFAVLEPPPPPPPRKPLKSWLAFAGAVVGLISFFVLLVLAVFIGKSGLPLFTLVSLALLILVTAGVYVLASRTATTGIGEFLRGFLVGFSTAFNWLFGTILFIVLIQRLEWPPVIVAAVLALVNFVAVIGPLANSEAYQAVLAWTNWLRPLAWLVVGLGLLLFVLNLLGHLILGLIVKVPLFRITGFAADWKTGTFFAHGGFVSNLNPLHTGFNMGNFSFIDAASSTMHIEHEAGHSLNLGAFGSVFHFVGAIDENLIKRGRNAFSERLAASNDPADTEPNVIPMWA